MYEKHVFTVATLCVCHHSAPSAVCAPSAAELNVNPQQHIRNLLKQLCISFGPPQRDFPKANDFGGEILPEAAKKLNVVAYPFFGKPENFNGLRSTPVQS